MNFKANYNHKNDQRLHTPNSLILTPNDNKCHFN
jgi:hypothetical protein